ncbi:PREDICTED: uncharacterized protein LOC101300771 [Fragaria vesca subsp. vesca]|uniref:uncharacterized protein LOC101300771 n=1 Tax=Fragaria vesca subsp. vesca TaxID=101020 RepID=UPI0002C367D0|nr:PREDICTED: uncharacterized protein LOC101300771 [Fragaria vesca subsp. vesca]
MHRSASWSRADEYYASAAKGPPGLRMSVSFFQGSDSQLPVYDPPIAELAKKEKARVKFAENAVHIIPFVLLLCAFILWFFSNPTEVGMRMKDPIAAKSIEGLTLEGEIENDSDGTQTGVLPVVDLGLDVDPTKQTKYKR